MERNRDVMRPPTNFVRALKFDTDRLSPMWTYLCCGQDQMDSIEVPVLSEAFVQLPYSEYIEKTCHGFIPHATTSPDGLKLITLTPGPYGGPKTGRCAFNGRLTEHNLSIAALGQPGYIYPWSARAVIICFKLIPEPNGKSARLRFEDVKMRHVRPILDWFLTNDLNPCIVPHRHSTRPGVPAIKINSVGDRRLFGLENMQEVVVPALAHSGYQWPSALAFMLGLPWICRLTQAHLEIFETYDFRESDRAILLNSEAVLVTGVYMDPNNRGMPLPSVRTLKNIRFQKSPGTVMIIHLNGAKVEIEHIKAFNEFMNLSVKAFEGDKEAFDSGSLNRIDFSQYWENYKRRKRLSLHSPYDVVPGNFGVHDENIMEWTQYYYNFYIQEDNDEPLSADDKESFDSVDGSFEDGQFDSEAETDVAEMSGEEHTGITFVEDELVTGMAMSEDAMKLGETNGSQNIAPEGVDSRNGELDLGNNKELDGQDDKMLHDDESHSMIRHTKGVEPNTEEEKLDEGKEADKEK